MELTIVRDFIRISFYSRDGNEPRFSNTLKDASGRAGVSCTILTTYDSCSDFA